MSLNDKVVMKGELSALVRRCKRRRKMTYEDDAIVYAEALIEEQATVIAILLNGRSYNDIAHSFNPRDKRIPHHQV